MKPHTAIPFLLTSMLSLTPCGCTEQTAAPLGTDVDPYPALQEVPAGLVREQVQTTPGGFWGWSSAIPPHTATWMRYVESWKSECPVSISELRYLRVQHWGFDGNVHEGELIVHGALSTSFLRIFARLFEARFPIETMRLVEDYAANDDRSMAANNTSAFNCRPKFGRSEGFSKHSYGGAIDINPIQNPYVSATVVAPPAGQPFILRNPAPGVIVADDVVVQAFTAEGFEWGGSWTSAKDYQHFEFPTDRLVVLF